MLKAPVDATSNESKAARQCLSLSQAEFARALGVGENDNTVRKIAFEWGKGTGHGPHAGGYGFCLDAQAMDSLCRGRAKA